MECDVTKKAINLAEAYDALSQEAFAVWMRLHVASDDEMKHRGKIARMLGYSEARSNSILRELRLAGYVTFTPGPYSGAPTTINLERRCKLGKRSRFVRLSRFLDARADAVREHIENRELVLPAPSPQNVLGRLVDVCPSMDSTSRNNANLSRFHGDSCLAECTSPEVEAVHSQPDALKSSIPGRRIGQMTKSSTRKSKVEDTKPEAASAQGKRPKRRAFHTYDGGLVLDRKASGASETIPAFIGEKKSLDLTRFSRSKRRAKRVLHRESDVLPPDFGKPIDWDKLDAVGLPQVTFTPDEQQRARWLILLQERNTRRLTGPERKMKQDLERKFQGSFIRIYETYRRMHQNEMRVKSTYGVMDSERKYALSAAIACLVKQVTPRQALEYWHHNIGDFADKGMAVPPLTFLSQAANIDAVAIHIMSKKHGRGSDRPKKGRGPSRHTMSDTSILHRGLRRDLMEAGFDMSEYNDKYLASIQAYAIDVVAGNTEVKFIPRSLRDMVKWAAENTFKDVDVEDYI